MSDDRSVQTAGARGVGGLEIIGKKKTAKERLGFGWHYNSY